MELITTIFTWATALVGSASMIVLALESIAKLTPTIKDDTILAKIAGYLTIAKNILAKIALNPSK